MYIFYKLLKNTLGQLHVSFILNDNRRTFYECAGHFIYEIVDNSGNLEIIRTNTNNFFSLCRNA